MSTDETPLIYTSRGNVPVDSLQYAVAWDHTDDRSVFVQEWRDSAGEIVRRDVHVGVRKPLELGAAQAQL